MNRTTLKKAIVIVLSVLVVGVIIYLAYQQITSGRVTSLTQLRSQISENGRITVDPNGGSQIVPGNIPMPKEAQVVESYEVASADGDIQGTRTYTSPKTINEELDIYKAYFSENSWQIKDEKMMENYAALLAARENKQMMVTIAGKEGSLRVSVTSFASPATY